MRQVLDTPELKPFHVEWYYNQSQDEYDVYASKRGRLQMIKGLPGYNVDDLHDLNKTRKNTVIVIDDLMEEAKDSKLVSKLFTQGRHRNVSVILILQNAFPKGKYNTEISRNAMYIVLFRSPADREQIKRVGQRMFPNNNDRFMDIYCGETEKAYGHILIDNKPETLAGHQVLSKVFGETLRYNIGGASKASCVQQQEPMVDDSILDEKSNTSIPPTPPSPLLSPLEAFQPWLPTVKKRKKNKRKVMKFKKSNNDYTGKSITSIRRDGVGWKRT